MENIKKSAQYQYEGGLSMKKRAMKKWIPKNTIYCRNCKWRSFNSKLPEDENGFCKYLGKSDYQLNEIYNKDSVDIFPCIDLHFPTSLLWDGCKECAVGLPDD